MKTSKYIIIALLAILKLGSCSSDSDFPEFPTKYARIVQSSITVKTEEENKITVHALFDSEETAKEKFTWSVSNPELASVMTNEDNSATILGLLPGQTTLKLESADGKLKYFSTLNVLKAYPFIHPILIDFGDVKSEPPFNNFKVSDKALTLLNDMKGFEFDYFIKIQDSFNTLSRNLSNTLGLPSEVSNDCFFNDGIKVESGTLVLGNLNKKLKYSLVFYGAINDKNTETEYRVKGSTEDVCYLNTSYNTSEVAMVKDILPDENGEIHITLKAGPNNTQWAKFYCINAMMLVPEGYELTLPLPLD